MTTLIMSVTLRDLEKDSINGHARRLAVVMDISLHATTFFAVFLQSLNRQSYLARALASYIGVLLEQCLCLPFNVKRLAAI